MIAHTLDRMTTGGETINSWEQVTTTAGLIPQGAAASMTLGFDQAAVRSPRSSFSAIQTLRVMRRSALGSGLKLTAYGVGCRTCIVDA